MEQDQHIDKLVDPASVVEQHSIQEIPAEITT